jgi:hypothetical protein
MQHNTERGALSRHKLADAPTPLDTWAFKKTCLCAIVPYLDCNSFVIFPTHGWSIMRTTLIQN